MNEFTTGDLGGAIKLFDYKITNDGQYTNGYATIDIFGEKYFSVKAQFSFVAAMWMATPSLRFNPHLVVVSRGLFVKKKIHSERRIDAPTNDNSFPSTSCFT